MNSSLPAPVEWREFKPAEARRFLSLAKGRRTVLIAIFVLMACYLAAYALLPVVPENWQATVRLCFLLWLALVQAAMAIPLATALYERVGPRFALTALSLLPYVGIFALAFGTDQAKRELKSHGLAHGRGGPSVEELAQLERLTRKFT